MMRTTTPTPLSAGLRPASLCAIFPSITPWPNAFEGRVSFGHGVMAMRTATRKAAHVQSGRRMVAVPRDDINRRPKHLQG